MLAAPFATKPHDEFWENVADSGQFRVLRFHGGIDGLKRITA